MIKRLAALSVPLLAALCLPAAASAQSIDDIRARAEAKLERSLQQLGSIQESAAQERAPMAARLNSLEAEVSELKDQTTRLERLRDARDVNLRQIEEEVEARREELSYSKNLLVEFLTNQSAGADAAERQLFEEKWLELLNEADAPAEDDAAAIAAVETLLEGVGLGVEREQRLVGGHAFDGRAVLPDGQYGEGRFLLYGPVTFFAAAQGPAGIAVQGASGEPSLVPLSKGETIGATLAEGEGPLPLDPTLGKALAMESAQETLLEHIQKGGFWIYPILAIAFVSLVVAIIKLFELTSIKGIPEARMTAILGALQNGDPQKARVESRSLSDYAHGLAQAALGGIGHGKEAVEQSLEEVLMRLQPRLDRLLPVIWITAATAPLLGLLGTVTGIITTFKLLTIFGSGDPRALGGGISEALVTTEFGLIVAIPSLVMHALLQRKAKAIESQFENDAMTLLNGILRSERASA